MPNGNSRRINRRTVTVLVLALVMVLTPLAGSASFAGTASATPGNDPVRSLDSGEVERAGTGAAGVESLSAPRDTIAQTTAPVSFSEKDIDGISVDNPTSIEFGPDGRLYVAQQFGVIKAYTLNRESDGSYTVTDTEVIDDIRSDIPNHDDDGTDAPNVDDRQVTGIHVAGTADDPVLYATSSDPRSGGGGGGADTDLDTNSGIVSKITWTNDGSREHTILVRGLPRSREKHSTNGLQLDESTNTLYIAQGGHTSRGAPSPEFDEAIEYALSGAILTVDLDQIDGMSEGTNANGVPVKYDLPTLGGTAEPFGGQSGANMAKWVDGGPVQVFSPGWRNPYDVELTEDGQLYTVDNGGAAGWGGAPINEGPGGVCTHEFNDPNNEEDPNSMQYITGEGYYGGHPNPTRGNPDGAATDVQNNVDYSPVVPSVNAQECDYLPINQSDVGTVNPGDGRGSLYVFGASTNGLDEYTASNFDGAMQGDILAASYSGDVYRVQLSSDGTQAEAVSSIAAGFGSIPLDVDAVGDDGPFPGTVWAAAYGSDSISVFEPTDYGGSDGGDTTCDTSDPDGDADGDGYTNGDEQAAGTDPCNAASQPEDADGDGVSDVTDTDDDNDGIPDTEDPFALDPDNGLSNSLPQTLDFEGQGNDPLDPGVGFTGLMTNGQDDYADLVGGTEVGAAAGVLTLTWDTGSAFGGTNTQKNAFQFGTTTPNEPFVIHTQVNDGFSGNVPEEFHNYGVFVGDGTQGDYAKLVIGARGDNDADGEVELAIETGDGIQDQVQVPDSSVIGGNVDLYMTVDPTTDPTPNDGRADYAVTFEYAVDGGQRTEVGSGPYALPASWFSDQDQGAAIGLIGTATGGSVDEFDGTYELLEAYTVADGPGGGNAAPTIDAIDDQSVAEGDSLSVDVTASDADGDVPTLTLTESPDFVTLTDDGDGTGTIEIAPGSGAAANSPYTVTVQADDGTDTVTESFQVTVEDGGDTVTDGTVEYRVNVGGPELSGSPPWTQDAEGSPSQYITTTEDIGFSDFGDSVTQKSASVPDDVPLDLYKTAKYVKSENQGDGTEMNWEFPVTQGATYEVRLYFAEPYFGSDAAPAGEGQRQFDVAVEGETRLENYDIYADVGFGTGTVKTFTATPSDGTLDVDLIDGAANNPIVNGVEIVKTSDAPGDPEASVAITPSSGVDASTFGNDAFQVENTGDVEITSVSIDTSTTILPDLVYDPAGTAGDGGDKSFQLGSGSDDVGVVSTADADLFDKPKDGSSSEDGYQRLTVEFDDFQSGETLTFGSDGDPTSIKGAGSAQQTEAGPVSGAELAGATVTVEFADGTTETVRTFGDGSAGGSEIVTSADQSVQPTLGVQDVQLDSNALDARHSAATVSNATQTVTVSGPAGATVQVMQAETELNLVDVPTYDGSPGYEVEAFEGNNFVGVTYDTVTLDANGQATLQVDVPSENLLYVMAAVENGDVSTGAPSNVVVLEQESDDGGETTTPGTVEYRVNVGGPTVSATGDGPDWSADQDGAPSQYLVTTDTSFSQYGGAVTQKASDVPEDVPLDVYNTARFVDTGGQQTSQSMDWEFPVQQGATYEVRLYFAEPYFGGSGPAGEGQREFDVAVEDQTELEDYDIYADVGFGTGTLKTFTVTPSDDTLDVDLIDGAANNPIVNGVEVVKTSDAPGDGNTAPTIDAIDDRTAVEGVTSTVDVTTSDADGDTPSLSLTQSPGFVTLTDDGDGTGTIEVAPGSGAAVNSPYTVTVQADDGTDTATESFQVTVEEAAASASVSINPDGGVDATTFANDAYQIENTGNVEITSVSIDTETTILPDLVYDPFGTAGDGGDKSFAPGANSDTVGVVSTADADLFDKPKNDAGGDDGYQRLTVEFDDFQPGETLTFGSDGDPTSIKGAANNVQNTLAGPVSGAELAGATVTVEFADGTTKTVRTFGDGSAGGSAVVSTADQTAPAPTLGVQEVSLDDGALDARHSAAYVDGTDQTLTVSGPAGATVQVMQADTELNLEGVPTYDGTPGYNIEAFEGNNFLSVSYQTVTLDSNGEATVDVTLPDDPEQPVYFMATVENADGSTGTPSNVVVLQNDPTQVDTGPDPIGDFDSAPTDPDGDGTYEDVNGDGSVNVGDAQAIFANTGDPVVQNNVAAFDFNGDGSVNVGDAQALFANGVNAGDA
jgi:hypothetical protein